MYLVTWTDSDTGKEKTLKLHTLRAATLTCETLKLDKAYRFRDIRMTYTAPRRVREIVIVVR